MARTIAAVFENGVFRPVESVKDIPDGAMVTLNVLRETPFAANTVDRAAIEQVEKDLTPEETVEMLRLLEEGRRTQDEG